MIIRELKKDAKIKLTGNYIRAVLIYLIYFIITFVISVLGKYLFQSNKSLHSIYELVILIFTVPLSFGITASILKITRNDSVNITDFIKIGIQNIKKVWITYLKTFIKLLLPFILLVASLSFFLYSFMQAVATHTSPTQMINIVELFQSKNFIISIILVLLTVIYLFYKALPYSLVYYVLYDNAELEVSQILEKSKNLMKKNKLNLITLMLSFILWYIAIYFISYIANIFIGNTISLIITFILSTLLLPYVTASTINFYEELKET